MAWYSSSSKEKNMINSLKPRWHWLIAVAILTAVSLGSVKATDLNPAAINIKLPDKITWSDPAAHGESQAILYGDPTKPGLYIMLIKWFPHHTSRPHFHPNDRFLTVLEGTWWVGTGAKYDPDSMVPMPKGSFVIHYGKQIHYDGAKDEPTMLEVVGEGPATGTPAEEK
jgi:hypothetical protein